MGACSSEDIPDDGENLNKENSIEISFNSKSYSIHKISTKSAYTRATKPGVGDEDKVENLYIFLFDTSGTNAVKHYFATSATTGDNIWSANDKKVTLKMSQLEAGKRQVYIVANIDTDLEGKLDDVSTIDALKGVFKTTGIPWSSNLTTPILMVGNKTHDFMDNRVLTAVPLERALAKAELKVKLGESFQSKVTNTDGKSSQYQYRYVDFDKNTYVLNPGAKNEIGVNINTSEWTNWDFDKIEKTTDNIATNLSLTTYLNERFTAGAKIEIRMMYDDSGLLPPPEFGFETYTLPLADVVVRNTWYEYDIEI